MPDSPVPRVSAIARTLVLNYGLASSVPNSPDLVGTTQSLLAFIAELEAASPRSSLTAPTEVRKALDELSISSRRLGAINEIRDTQDEYNARFTRANHALSKVEDLFRALLAGNEQTRDVLTAEIAALRDENEKRNSLLRESAEMMDFMRRENERLSIENEYLRNESEELRRERDELLKQVQNKEQS